MKPTSLETVLAPDLGEILEDLARRDGSSLREKVREVLREGLEALEDRGLVMLAERRRRSLKGRRLLSHEEVWGSHRRRGR